MSRAILLPVYNEASTLGFVLDSVRRQFSGEILVVDDGSTDDTGEVLAARTDVTVISNSVNAGYGAALSAGFTFAYRRGVSELITMDCDGQHEPAHIPDFFSLLSQGADIISGSRYLPESREIGKAPASRSEINVRVTREVNRVTGWSLTDSFCGFKAYRLAAISGFEWKETGYGFPLEVWAKAYNRGLIVVESPVERIYHDYNRSFGPALDDPEVRFEYYMRVWRSALAEGGGV